MKEVGERDPIKLAGRRPDDGGDNGEFYPARFDARRLLRKIVSADLKGSQSGRFEESHGKKN
jgi:hypothetical protein